MKTLDDVFSCWTTMADMSQDTGIGEWALQKCRQRRRINQAHWDAVIGAVRRKGQHLTADMLIAMHKPPLPRRRATTGARAFR